jgi:hypothetical protein
VKKLLLALWVGILLGGCEGEDASNGEVEKLEKRLAELEDASNGEVEKLEKRLAELEHELEQAREGKADPQNGDGRKGAPAPEIDPSEATELIRTNESLAWELERLRLKLVTVDGADMILVRQTGLYHYDTQRKPFTGRAVSKFEDGALKYDGTFHEGKLDGVEKYGHPNGQLKKELTWLDGQLHGYVTEWDANGTLVSRKRYERGEEVNAP